MKNFLKKNRITVILVVVLAVGLGLLFYPTASDKWNTARQTREIASYQEAVGNLSAEEKASMLKAARAYNEQLAQREARFFFTGEEEAEYEKLLDVTGTGIMGYVEIPSINVNLPIYHGTKESVLQIAAGHLEGTSLPVGGENTHAAVSGHRGLPSAKLFTDLDRLEEGDVFTVTVLDETITYKVDQIRIVLPEETSELMIKQGEDHMTLVTCTPYGVNSHRILVRGTRTQNMLSLSGAADAERVPVYLVIIAILLPILVIFLLVLTLFLHRRKPRMSGGELLEAYRRETAGAVAAQKEPPADAQKANEEPSEAKGSPEE